MRQAVIVAGGKGTRLKPVLGDLPKPLAEVGGKPLLEHQLDLLERHAFDDVVLLTGSGAEEIERRFGDRARYVRESEPLGTAGAVLNAFEYLADRFIVLYGDTMLNVDFDRMWSAHPCESAATLFLHPNDHPHDSDLVEVDESGRVTGFHPYPHEPGNYFRNLVNAGLYVFGKNSLEPFRGRGFLDFGKHVLPELVARGAPVDAYITREYIKDAGTPKRLERVRADFASGRIASSAFDNPLPAVFFDRDGTLNEEVPWISKPEQLSLISGAAEAVNLVNERGWLAVVITNQGVVARGECTEAGLRVVHNKLEWLLGEQHAYLDGLYYCPHHPDKGFPGERADLKIACACRKPGTELIERAVRDLNIDLARSWFVGDRATDVRTAENAGIRSALVLTSYGKEASKNCQPTLTAGNVLEAVKAIL